MSGAGSNWLSQAVQIPADLAQKAQGRRNWLANMQQTHVNPPFSSPSGFDARGCADYEVRS